MKRIGIIGGGASGLVAAITAARANSKVSVFILEQKEQLGKKILATGNGRCNLTNEYMDISCFRSHDIESVQGILEQFGTKETLDFFASIGLVTKNKEGYIYPRSEQAQTVLSLLTQEIKRLGIEVITGTKVEQIISRKNGFRILTAKETYDADRVILATGGKANSPLGSDGSGYTLAKSLGHSLVPVVPALVQLVVEANPFSKAAGVRAEACVSVFCDGEKMAEDTGELQLTAYGISGIPVFQISRYAAMGLYNQQKVEVEIDFVPEMHKQEFYHLLLERVQQFPNVKLEDFFLGIFNKKLDATLLWQTYVRGNTKVADVTREQWQNLAMHCKFNRVTIQDTKGFEHAQVCAGGVNLTEIDVTTMQSKVMEGLYLTGELLDVDGICGGYNLQMAWATGHLAGCAASRD